VEESGKGGEERRLKPSGKGGGLELCEVDWEKESRYFYQRQKELPGISDRRAPPAQISTCSFFL